ncbi:MAG: hypothetical protein JXA33_11385 [Anaerolineae bacterium]|nr:hypothetical protein [Anaerolineae bacterium]
MRPLELLTDWFAYRRARRRWRDAMTLLTLMLICVLLNLSFFCCGLIGYTLQQIGVLPTSTPAPAGADLIPGQVGSMWARATIDSSGGVRQIFATHKVEAGALR